jgi:molybdopterin-binding protein
MERSEGGQRLVDIEEVSRLLDERRKAQTDRPIVAQSARNRFAGVVTRIERDRVAAVVEVIAGPHRLVSLMTAEAIDDLDLKVGDEAVCVVKATNVMVEIPSYGGHADGPDVVRCWASSPSSSPPARAVAHRLSVRPHAPPRRLRRAWPHRWRRRRRPQRSSDDLRPPR